LKLVKDNEAFNGGMWDDVSVVLFGGIMRRWKVLENL
jgi:hypothetical protein